MTILPNLRRFISAFVQDLILGKKLTSPILKNIEYELERRGFDPEDAEFADDWKLLNAKLGFLPMISMAISVYAVLAGLTYGEICQQRGLTIFKLIWAIASRQDDRIDVLDKKELQVLADKKTRIRIIRDVMFRDVFYQAAYRCLIDSIYETFDARQKLYISKALAYWFKFLSSQEAEVCTHELMDCGFEICRKYREAQNAVIGTALIVCLNGTRCLDPVWVNLETPAPVSFAGLQIIDDIVDLDRDLRDRQLSYTIGALVDNPDEFERVKNYLNRHRNRKMTTRLYKKLAPESNKLIYGWFREYNRQLEETFRSGGKFFNKICWGMFYVYPVIRNILHR